MSNEQEHAHFCHEIYYVVVNIYENPTGSFEEWKIAILKENDLCERLWNLPLFYVQL